MNLHDCNAYDKIFPVKLNGKPFFLSQHKNYRIYSIYNNGVYSIYNLHNKTIIINKHDVHIESDKICTLYKITQHKIANESIREYGTYNNICYNDLNSIERDTLIPTNLVSHKNISRKALFNWELACNSQFTSTLIYTETHDKDFIFIDENNGYKYKYNIDNMRLLIPYIINGKITGTFVYKTNSITSVIRYVPTLYVGTNYNTNLESMICESDDSDYNNE